MSKPGAEGGEKGRKSAMQWRRMLVAGGGILLLLGGYWWWWGGDTESLSGTVFEVRRGPMEIVVLEGGSIEAQVSQAIVCEVQGQTKILSIVEEGYLITQADVEGGKVLVELDSKDLLDRQTEQELQYQTAVASFAESKEGYDIQINQNESDIKAVELDVKFALMDFEKYLGQQVAGSLLKVLGLDDVVARMRVVLEEAKVEAEALASEALVEVKEGAEDSEGPLLISHAGIDFSDYASESKLGDGEARQQLRKLEDSLSLAVEDLALAKSDLEGTQRLFEKDFVTKSELENDQMAYKRKEVSLAAAETSKGLFIKYEFPKMAEKLLSDYEEALRKLLRAHKLARSKMVQAKAKMNSAEARYSLQNRKRNEIQEQLEKCVIRAEHTGLVVYGSGDNRYYRNNDQIEEGATVRERQVIITIPNTTKMAVKVQVHESVVKRVRKGLEARVRVDSNPDKVLTAYVEKIAVLPDSQNRWMNPDLKVYSTMLYVEGEHPWLKPGMSAEAEIIIDRLGDVVQAPLQAVRSVGEEKVVYVLRGGKEEMRKVKTGAFNESFIEIESGLSVGEQVLLRTLTPLDGGAGEEAGGAPEASKGAKEGGGRAEGGPGEKKAGEKKQGRKQHD